jgi:hypothetical protein
MSSAGARIFQAISSIFTFSVQPQIKELETLKKRQVMKKIQSRKIILPHVLLSSFLFSLVMFVAGDSHAAPTTCLDRGSKHLAFPSDFTEDSTFSSTFVADYPNSLEHGAVGSAPNPTPFDRTQTNSVFNLITAASNSGCSGLRLEGGIYEISHAAADTFIIPEGFHLRGSTRGAEIPNTEIRGVATGGDMRASLIRVEGDGSSSRTSTISRLLLNNVQIVISGDVHSRLANVVVTRVVLFNTNFAGPQVKLNHVGEFKVSESIFLRGDAHGGKGLQTDNSTLGSISENCFGGESGTPVNRAPNAGCPDYFEARSVTDLVLTDQGHFITAWNASEGLTESRFENNWVEGNTDITVNVSTGSDTKVDHGIYVKFAHNITIIGNHFEGWPFEGDFSARGHLKVRNASNISILSNDIVGMHVDLRPSITDATTTWQPESSGDGRYPFSDVLRQSCTLIEDNYFVGGDVSYKGARTDGTAGSLTTQVMVKDNEFQTNSDYARAGHIRRTGAQLNMHDRSANSFWVATGNSTDGSSPYGSVLFDSNRWNVDGAGHTLGDGQAMWTAACP